MTVRELRSLFIAAGAAAAFACSGQDGSDETQIFEAEALAPMSSEEREAEFQRQLATPLSDEERLAVEDLLLENGMDMTDVGFAGRMVTFGDAYLDADSLLSAPLQAQGLTEKGRTLAVTDPNPGTNGLPIAPIIFSQIFNGNYQFMRPDISGSGIRVVVPNAAAAAFLVPAFTAATTAIRNAANDCITGFSAMTQAQYDALPYNDQIFIKPIFVRYGALASVCAPTAPTNTTACALFPRKETREFDINFSQTRLVPGPRIGVNSALITANNATTVRILTHELMHTLGIAHSEVHSSSVAVIGTLAAVPVGGSIMRQTAASSTLSPDDIDTIDTLFSPLPGKTCGWLDGLKNIPAN